MGSQRTNNQGSKVERTLDSESRQLSYYLGCSTNKLMGHCQEVFVFFSYKIQKLHLMMAVTFLMLLLNDSINRLILKKQVKETCHMSSQILSTDFIIYLKMVLHKKELILHGYSPKPLTNKEFTTLENSVLDKNIQSTFKRVL